MQEIWSIKFHPFIFGVQKCSSSTSICEPWSHDKFQKGKMQSYSKALECIIHVPFFPSWFKEYLDISNIKFHHSIFGVHRSVYVNHGAMTSSKRDMQSYSKALKCIIHVPSFPPHCRNILSYSQILFCCRINRGSSYSSWTPNSYHYLIQMHRLLGI